MSLPSPPTQPPALSEGQRKALISLLADEDPAVYQVVRDKLLSFAPQVSAWLRPHTLSSDPLLRRRAQEIIRHLERQAADSRFVSFCLSQGEELDLEQGAWLLAQTHYPDFNVEAYRALLDQYADQLSERLQPTGGVEGILQPLNDFLIEELGFAGNEANYYEPDNSYLNRVIDQRTGNPISLCTVYLLLARRLHLPIVGIGLPGHFICRYQTPTQEIYVDVFNRGKLLTKVDCIRYLVHTHHGLEEGHLVPVSPRRMLLRMCTNLHQIYLHHDRVDEVTRLQSYMAALTK